MDIITDKSDILRTLCRDRQQWGMYISYDPNQAELTKAAPYLMEERFFASRFEGEAYILADTEKEVYSLYANTVGDDGPCRANPYNGPARVYAMICDPTGMLASENT